MSSSSPEAKPAQPKDAQDQSGAKGSCFVLIRLKKQRSSPPFIGMQTSFHLLVVLYRVSGSPTSPLTRALAEQEKKADNGATATANIEASAPVTSSKVAPVSTPPLSEKPPILPSDSKPAPTSPDPEKGQDTAVPTTAVGVPFEPALRVPDTQERRRKRRLLIIHTRLARFFSWILLLGFVILPSTFSRDHQDNATQGTTGSPGSQAGGNGNTGSPLRHIYNVSLYVSFRSPADHLRETFPFP